MYNIEKIKSGEFNPIVSASNHRLNTLFTSLPKILRGFIVCNGKTLHNIDINASQPYMLATIINNDFLLNEQLGQYNLYTIYPDLHKTIKNKYNKTDIKYINRNKINIINNIINTHSPFMWCVFLTY